MDHFLQKCSKCGVTISQCRCMATDKTVTYDICDSCKSALEIVHANSDSKISEETKPFDLGTFYEKEIEGAIDLIPEKYRVYVKGADKHDSLAAILAISVAKLVRALEK